jgi:nucleoside-triphosphatase
VGKTTLVRTVIARGIPLAGGFVTEEIRRQGQRTGFRVTDVLSGHEGTLASATKGAGPKVGKYTVDLASFEDVGVAALKEAMARSGCIVIDEIGKMELKSAAFRQAVSEAMDSQQDILATIPFRGDAFVERLRARPGVELITITADNRDALVEEIASRLGAEPRAAGQSL